MIPPSNCQLRSPLVEPFTLCFVLRGRLIVARSIRRVSRGSVFGDFAAAHEAPPWHGFRCSAGCDPRFRMSLNGKRTRFCLKYASRRILIHNGKSASVRQSDCNSRLTVTGQSAFPEPRRGNTRVGDFAPIENRSISGWVTPSSLRICPSCLCLPRNRRS